MKRVTRRDVLHLGATGAAGLTLGVGLPVLAVHRDDDPPPSELDVALARARSRGVPLLVLVQPRPFLGKPPYDRSYEDGQPLWWWADNPAFYDHGEVLGQWLMHADDEAMAHLALCEVVCATPADLATALPGSVIEGEPLICLVEAARAGSVLVIDPKLPEVEASCGFGTDLAPFEEQVRARVAALSRAVNAALAPDRSALERRAAEACAAGCPIGETVAFRLMAAQAEGDATRRARLLAPLAELGVELRERAPAGARWATNSGCGIDIEGAPETVGIACGMGFTPEISRRFLSFYAS